MAYETGILDQAENAHRKQECRAKDERRLATSEVTRGQLAVENGFLTSLPLHEFKITSVGGRPLSTRKATPDR